jgi:hypothetical protein
MFQDAPRMPKTAHGIEPCIMFFLNIYKTMIKFNL